MSDLLSWKPNKTGRPKKPPRLKRAPAALEFRTACAFSDTLSRFGDLNWRWTHFPAGEHRNPATGARLKRMGLKKGWPDYLFIDPAGRLHCLEMKRAGEALSDQQVIFQTFCRAAGVPHCVAWSYKDAVEACKAWGVLPSTIKIS